MMILETARRRLGIAESGHLAWLSGGDGENRVVQEGGPPLRIVALHRGQRHTLEPAGPPAIRHERNRLELRWETLQTRGGTRLQAIAVATVTAEDGRFVWHLRLESLALQIIEALYPVAGGLRGDTLLCPHHAGERISDPARTLLSDRYRSFHRGATVEEEGRFAREMPYCGLASMAWLELDGSGGGTYLGSHDPTFGLTGLRVETDGAALTLALRRCCRLEDGAWEAPPAVLVPHESDWHEGARLYRDWIAPLLPQPQAPPLMAGKVALNPRYDFKNGGKVHHRFSEIPAMFEAGLAYGLDHFFLAGWNRGGFDTCYPEYYPDMELGTAGELAAGCRQIAARGGAATFYINARIFDTASDYFPTLGTQWAIKDENGEPHFEVYPPNRFAVMCPDHEPWRRHIADTARWLLGTTGCQGIYLDQLGSATPYPCYDPAHAHEHTGGFNQGYTRLLDELRPEAALMIENCGDIYSSRVWASYCWNGEPYDEFFNLYRYTFPEHRMVTMVHPRHVDDPAAREAHFHRDLQRAWLLGSLFWTAPQRRFKPGEEHLLDLLKQAIALRKAAEPFLAPARFMDDLGMSVQGPAQATRFDGPGYTAVAVANPSGDASVLHLPFRPAAARCLTLGAPSGQEWRRNDDGTVTLPDAPLSLLILTAPEGRVTGP